jgi:hypothetical protein
MKRFAIITLATAALTSCASPMENDFSQFSSIRLCDDVLNFRDAGRVQGGWREAKLEELSRRGEDCSDFTHLRQPTSSDINVNVEN